MIVEHLAYLRHLNRRRGTIDQRRWCLQRLQTFLGHDLATATHAELLAFVSRGDRGAETRCAEISHVRGFYGWAIEHDHLELDPSLRLRRPRRPRHLPRPMPDADLARALATARDPIRTWLHLAAYGGLRCCEIAPLRGEDYLRGQGVLVIREQKGGDPGAISVGPVLAEVLAGLPMEGWWFTRWDGILEPISAGQLQRHANRWLHEQGIAHTTHAARHWFGTYMQRASGNLRVTQEAMRHRSPVSTAGYTFVGSGEVAQVVARLPRLAETA